MQIAVMKLLEKRSLAGKEIKSLNNRHGHIVVPAREPFTMIQVGLIVPYGSLKHNKAIHPAYKQVSKRDIPSSAFSLRTSLKFRPLLNVDSR